MVQGQSEDTLHEQCPTWLRTADKILDLSAPGRDIKMRGKMFRRNIFKDLEAMIFNENADNLGIRDGHKESINDFLANPTPDTALNLFKFIEVIHQKHKVFELLNDLKLYEKGHREILPEHRDHYMHSASVYVLGLAIYNTHSQIRESLCIDRHSRCDHHEQKTSFLFRWSMAACLHDTAYPLEIALKSFNRYAAKLHELKGNDSRSLLYIDSYIYDHFNLLPILSPHEDIGIEKRDTALGLIAEHITRIKPNWSSPISYGTLVIMLDKHLKCNLEAGIIDHGVFSAFILLYRVYHLYKERQWDIKDFYYELVDSATAIFLHNMFMHSNLTYIFGNGKYTYDHPSALGFLLFLCDSMCEWSRSQLNDASQYGLLALNNDSFLFRVPWQLQKKINKAVFNIDTRIPINIITTWKAQHQYRPYFTQRDL